MTFVDDNLLGVGPMRASKSGAKTAGKQHDMDAAKQRSAFENAFADAGKKQQPAISIGKSSAEETSIQPRIAAALNLADTESKAEPHVAKIPAAFEESSINAPAAENDADALLPLESLVPQGDDVMKSTIGNSMETGRGKPLPALPGEDVKSDPFAAGAGEEKPKFTLMRSDSKTSLLPSISLVALGEDATADAGQTVDESVGAKIADLLGDEKALLSDHVDSRSTVKSDDTPPSTLPEDAGVAATDVSQLLTLLGATQKLVAASAAQRTQAAPVISEFQALADRAGKTKAAQKDGTADKPAARAEGDANAVRNATQAGTDQVFRFARADGKGQAVSMSLASDGDKTVAKSDLPATASPTAKTETVTVLEARRYLGLAPVSNASAVTSQIASNPEWARALQPSAAESAPLTAASTGKVLNTLKIQMHPIDLGTVTATLRLKDDELHVELKVETGDAFRQLSDDQNAMVKALRAQGFAVDQVNVVFNAPDSSGGNGAQQQAQPQAGPQGREAAADGSAQGRGQRNDNGSQEQGRGRWTGNDGTGDVSSGTEPGRAGDVYM
ncbi:flagellar hook-length control protein FliK [Pararhizobium sp. BT-229]|uniref:flagellar hook-length control protein FliK n=1 Tax=Pararhizobium sp. BT-229 TaxID=2986923 RepID=UPI0021F79E92|nr:flagellar hook-length control protein FliK [Pararhizobium sp. BT-229]MCV9962838.1 flagellar hook-length control protein FliK [Pararhizobium sp. BT-229]